MNGELHGPRQRFVVEGVDGVPRWGVWDCRDGKPRGVFGSRAEAVQYAEMLNFLDGSPL